MNLILLLMAMTQPQLTVKAPIEFEPYQPIVIESNYEKEDGTTVLFDWVIDRPAQLREVDNGHTVHVWAPPGKYEATLTILKTKVDFEKKTVTQSKEKKYFTIIVKGKEPDPEDPIVPVPNGKVDRIVVVMDQDTDTVEESQQLALLRETSKVQLLVIGKAQVDRHPELSQYKVPDGEDYPYFFEIAKDGKVIRKGHVSKLK